MYIHVCTMFRHVCTVLPNPVQVVRIPDDDQPDSPPEQLSSNSMLADRHTVSSNALAAKVSHSAAACLAGPGSGQPASDWEPRLEAQAAPRLPGPTVAH